LPKKFGAFGFHFSQGKTQNLRDFRLKDQTHLIRTHSILGLRKNSVIFFIFGKNIACFTCFGVFVFAAYRLTQSYITRDLTFMNQKKRKKEKKEGRAGSCSFPTDTKNF